MRFFPKSVIIKSADGLLSHNLIIKLATDYPNILIGLVNEYRSPYSVKEVRKLIKTLTKLCGKIEKEKK